MFAWNLNAHVMSALPSFIFNNIKNLSLMHTLSTTGGYEFLMQNCEFYFQILHLLCAD